MDNSPILIILFAVAALGFLGFIARQIAKARRNQRQRAADNKSVQSRKTVETDANSQPVPEESEAAS